MASASGMYPRGLTATSLAVSEYNVWPEARTNPDLPFGASPGPPPHPKAEEPRTEAVEVAPTNNAPSLATIIFPRANGVGAGLQGPDDAIPVTLYSHAQLERMSKAGLQLLASQLRDKLGTDRLPPLLLNASAEATVKWVLDVQVNLAKAAGLEDVGRANFGGTLERSNSTQPDWKLRPSEWFLSRFPPHSFRATLSSPMDAATSLACPRRSPVLTHPVRTVWLHPSRRAQRAWAHGTSRCRREQMDVGNAGRERATLHGGKRRIVAVRSYNRRAIVRWMCESKATKLPSVARPPGFSLSTLRA